MQPLHKLRLAESVVKAVLERPPDALPPQPFLGAGIYALYYHGDFPLYAPIARVNAGEEGMTPIYVGKAVPKGARRGGVGLGVDAGPVLFNRLREHGESIRQASNLRVDDFRCRYLVVDDIWIALGEQLLIERYSPLWNSVLDGFGNHDPGAGRYKQQRSPWDVLHPGRPWADRLQPSTRSREAIERRIAAHFIRQVKRDPSD